MNRFLQKRLPSIFLFFSLIIFSSQSLVAQGFVCAAATEFCLQNGLSYPANTNAPAAEPGPNYGCLGTQPNPAWFYIEVQTPGTINVSFNNSSGVDIDYALWGPFADYPTAIGSCGSGLGAPIQCSYSPSPTESMTINGMTPGEVYILLITNFSNQPTDIIATASGSGVTACGALCLAEGGTVDAQPLSACLGDPSLVLNLPPGGGATTTGAYTYEYVIVQGGIIQQIVSSADLSGLPPGNYEICGFSYLTADATLALSILGQPYSVVQADLASGSAIFCGDLSDNCKPVTIGDLIPPTLITQTVCAGECINFAGQQICEPGGDVTLTSYLGCDSVISFILIPYIPAPTFINEDVCPGGCIDAAGGTYCAPGPHVITVPNFLGCDSLITIILIEKQIIPLIIPVNGPIIDCGSAGAILDGSSSLPAGDYSWSGPSGNLGSAPIITVTDPGDYTLTIIDNTENPPCMESTSITIFGGLGEPNLLVTDFPVICAGQTINLASIGVVDINGVATTFTYHTDTPATPANQITDTNVTLDVTSVFYVFADVGGCTSEVPLIVTVQPDIIPLIIPIGPPFLGCNGEPVLLDGSSSVGPPNYQWTGPTGNMGSGPTFNADIAGEYTLTIVDNAVTPPCEASTTFTIFPNIGAPNLLVADAPIFCEGDTIDLNDINIIDINGTTTSWTFHTSTPATPANEVDSEIFVAEFSDLYYVYAENNGCESEAILVITVLPDPLADFTATSSVCTNEPSTITYTGVSGTDADYNWDFAGGVATPGTGQGPHTVTWSAPGNYTISLVITEGGCSSEAFEQTVIVGEPAQAPVINCGAIATNSVEFIWNSIPGSTGYTVNVITGQVGTQNDTTFTVNNLTAGEIVTIEVTVDGLGTCGNATATETCQALNCGNITLEIADVDDICLNGNNTSIDLNITIMGDNGTGSGTWTGTGITDENNGIFDPVTAGIGNHLISYTYIENGCDFMDQISIDVLATPDAEFTVISPICNNQSSTIDYIGTASSAASFNWNFDGGTATPGAGIGPHTVEWSSGGTKTITLIVEENGCLSEQFTATIQVDEPLAEPVINCNTDINSIEFIWNAIAGADTYNISVLSGATGMMNSDTSYLVTGLNPNDIVTIEVEAVNSNNTCGSSTATATCEAQNCPSVTVEIEDVAAICLATNSSTINLVANQLGGAGGGTFTWSGDGIIDTNTGTFDPNAGSIGNNDIVVTYQEGTCTYNGSISINVFEIPNANFSVDSPNCVDENIIVNYTGNASSSATYTWDFAGATASSTTGPGPHTISWSTAGIYDIELTVEENGCSSMMNTQQVTIEAPIEIPLIDCNTTTNSIEFVWGEVDGATGYNVTLISGTAGNQVNDTTYLVTDLNAGDQVSIEVEVITNNICGNVVAEQTCIASNCPTVTVEIAPVDDICLNASAQPIDLTAMITGNTISGILTWSGDAVTNATFDPTTATIGNNQISVIYEENNCSYSGMSSINVFAQPTGDFMIENAICIDSIATVTYQGIASDTADFQWNFDGGTIISGDGEGPYEISWADPGNYQVSLIVIDNNCASENFDQSITVEPALVVPTIDCFTNTSQIEFVWNQVNNASGYMVNVLAGNSGIMSSDTSYLVTGLMPEDEVIIQLIIESGNNCANITTIQSCLAQDCPNISLDLSSPSPVCISDGLFDISATVTGSDGSGMGSWGGIGIIDTLSGSFDPTIAGIGTTTISYNFMEAGCSFTQQLDIIVEPEINAPVYNCNTTTETVEIIWDPVLNATDYQIDITSGQMGMMSSDTSYLITGLSPNTIVDFVITANGNTICGPSSTTGSCTAQDCPTNVEVTISEVSAVCANDANTEIQLEVEVLNGTGNGVWSGDGITNDISGIFDITAAGVGNHVIVYTYTQGDCIYTDNITINVQANPIANFLVESTICQTDAATVNFTGSATNNAVFSWNFDGGVAIPGGNEPGPHTVTWSSGGTKNISLVIQDDICESMTFTQSVEVEIPLSNPVVNCNTTTESVEFIWENVLGATGYTVNVLTGQTGTSNSDTSIVFNNLDPNEVVSIEIEVISGGTCDNVIFPVECEAIECPDISVNISEVSPICLTSSTTNIDLAVTVSGGIGGTGIWSGTGVSDLVNGIFDPNQVGAGVYQVVYTFTEGNCSYNNSINIEVVDAPTADAGQSVTLTCEPNGSSVQLGGIGNSAGSNISYDWDWSEGAFPGDSTIANPIISLPGTYTINVINDALGCSAQSAVNIGASQEIPIPEIVVSDISCFGESDGILEVVSVDGGEAPYLYSLNGNTPGPNPEFTDLSPGAYNLVVTDVNGCSNLITIAITEPNELEVDLISLFDGENIIIIGDTINLQAVVNVPIDSLDVVQWAPPQFVSCDTCVSVAAFPVETTTFSVLIESEECEARDDLLVIVDNPDFPNAISPNGDGKNETFVIPGLERFDNPRMTIVNRWGSVVWDSQPYQNEWGGTNQDGEPLPGGTYYYVLRYDLQNGEIITGHVTIIY